MRDTMYSTTFFGKLTTTWYQPSKLHEDLQETTFVKVSPSKGESKIGVRKVHSEF